MFWLVKVLVTNNLTPRRFDFFLLHYYTAHKVCFWLCLATFNVTFQSGTRYPTTLKVMAPFLLFLFLLFGTILTFQLIRYIFENINPSWNRLSNPFLWITTLFALPISYFVLFLLWGAIISYYPERTFDKEKWKESTEKRYEYADDLVDSHKLIGLRKEEVIELLGRPFHEYEGSLDYDIGYYPGTMAMDPWYLQVDFKDGKVHKVFIRRG